MILCFESHPPCSPTHLFRNCVHRTGGMYILLKNHIQFCSYVCLIFSDCTFFSYFKTWFHCWLGLSHNPSILGGRHWLILRLSIPFWPCFLQEVSFSKFPVTHCLTFHSASGFVPSFIVLERYCAFTNTLLFKLTEGNIHVFLIECYLIIGS